MGVLGSTTTTRLGSIVAPLQNNMTAQNIAVALTRATNAHYLDDAGVMQTVSSSIARQTPVKGLFIEGQDTNTLLHSRDLTQASWTTLLGTVARTSVGLDGVSNSATRITATAINCTVLQIQTNLASAARTASIYLKRVTGTGDVQLTTDGVGYTTVTLTTSFQRFNIEAAAATGLTFGIRMVTSGDAIDADCAQTEVALATRGPSSFITTTTTGSTRNRDAVTIPV